MTREVSNRSRGAVAIKQKENNFYVVDQGNHAVRVISPDAAGRTTVSTLCGFGMPVITVRSAGDEGDSDEDRLL